MTHTLGRAPLDEGSAHLRDLCLTTHYTHKRQTSMPPAGFGTAIPARERPQTYALNRAVIGIGGLIYFQFICLNVQINPRAKLVFWAVFLSEP